MKQKCPICHKTIKAKAEEKPEEKSEEKSEEESEEAKFYPFCSSRCKLVDLGVWLDAGYKISQSQEAGESSNTGHDVPSDR